ncbi:MULTISPECIES: FAD binding domain-containing protein [Streptomyces]|uniref:Xanthine dehydrogenase family protein subunit M n=1 Tax=Streptomyces dengpaensis TaxID=2049881 RepID=A0ABM6SK04_9ACTN|nr:MULTISPECIES: xanthine dehydrogenase family protein subunit M [Streptomyces]AVH54950.1 xanthine dehydrogenase family protein subunit M [Streptomyces dengpaensis]PIB08248.1 carbon monoxide dehydrogenase [Streptomyces sp. HG99]
MIPPAFEYARPTSVDEAVRTLADAGEDAKVLAGGQSLLPLLRLRLAFPELVVDVGRIPELRGIREGEGTLIIGAMTSHHDVIRDPRVCRHAGLLAAATATVADPAVRHRGTLGGSLAHADPAGDLPAVILALDATLIAVGPEGRRAIPAREFFVDYLQTALRPDELLVEVEIPTTDGWGFHYEKFNRVAQAWAVVGVAALVRRDNGHITASRIGLTNMGSTPLRAAATEEALVGADAAGSVRRAAQVAADGTHPSSDPSASPAYRAHLARVLTRRAVLSAAGMG